MDKTPLFLLCNLIRLCLVQTDHAASVAAGAAEGDVQAAGGRPHEAAAAAQHREGTEMLSGPLVQAGNRTNRLKKHFKEVPD